MTHPICFAWRFHRKTLRISGCGHIPCAMDRSVQIGAQFVFPGDDDHALSGTECQTGQPVAPAVDVDDLTGLGNGIGTAEIDIGPIGVFQCGRVGGPLKRLRHRPDWQNDEPGSGALTDYQ